MSSKQQEFDWSKAHPWMRAAYDFGKLNEGWFEVRPNSEEHKAWEAYFRDLGWTPQTFHRMRKEPNARWTAPCQWPEWLTIDKSILDPPKPRLRLASQAEI